MKRAVHWIKNHKLITVLIVVVTFFLLRDNVRSPMYFTGTSSFDSMEMAGAPAPLAVRNVGSSGKGMAQSNSVYYEEEYAPTDNTNRMVVATTHLSLLVDDVSKSAKQIADYAASLGGYMVSSNVTSPEEGGSGTVVIRVPASKLDETMETLKTSALKVVSENRNGQDVTDQYEDMEERLRILEGNKARFEEIMDQATEISDVLNIQREVFNLQSQIDSIKGRQKYLEQTSKTAKITVYLSTDELALPYAPSDTWHPQTVFKQAVRAMMTTLYKGLSLLIWITVYAVIWVPIALLIYFIWKRYNKKRPPLAPPTN